MRFAKNELLMALEKQNAFFETTWSVFEAEMKKIDRNPFKETKTFDLE